jgi:integron integrase
LDFCSKYQHDATSSGSLDAYLIKLTEKKQPHQQKNLAQKAVRFYQSFMAQSSPEQGSESQTGLKIARTQKGMPPNITEKMPGSSKNENVNDGDQTDDKSNIHVASRGCSWAAVYKELEGAIRIRHYSQKTLKSYRGYVRTFQTFTKSPEPRHLNAEHVKAYLTYLAVEKKVSASTQNLAFNALLFLYRHVLNKDFGKIEGVVRAKKRPYIPVVLSKNEIAEIFKKIDPQYLLIVKLLYGCGLRLFECLNLRVHCLNFDAGILTIHDGKGQKDRTVPIPEALQTELRDQLMIVQQLHQKDLEKGYGGAFLFNSIERKYKNASREFIWQWLFPAKQLTKDKESGQMKRYHIHPSHVQKALRKAVLQACLTKRVTAHTFRHSYASHLLQAHYDIRTIQELLGHSDVRTTMMYTHTVKSVTVKEARSPLDF